MLGIALAGAALIGVVLFAILLAVYAVGYVVSLVHAQWRLHGRRRRAVFVDAAPKTADTVLEAEYKVVEVSANSPRRGSSDDV